MLKSFSLNIGKFRLIFLDFWFQAGDTLLVLISLNLNRAFITDSNIIGKKVWYFSKVFLGSISYYYNSK